jgi:protease-4
MSGKRGPIMIVLVILVCAALFLGGTMIVIGKILGSPQASLSFGNKIGVIPIIGPINDSHKVLRYLVKFRKDRGVQAIIVRINSPGGRVAPAQEIYREIQKTAATKSVIVSIGDMAASGGYYIAAAGDKIIANPGTMLGSIGVIIEFLQIQELLQKAGVGFEVLKSGEFKDIGSPHREMTPRERSLMMDLIRDIQEQFVKAVAQGRDLPLDQVREIADGRVFSGIKGKELGLIDRLGNFQDAVSLAKEIAGIKGEATLVYPERPKVSLLELLIQGVAKGLAEASRELLQTRLEYRWDGIPPLSSEP